LNIKCVYNPLAQLFTILLLTEDVDPYKRDVAIRVAEREFAKKLRDENMRLKRVIAERDERDAVYFADIEVRKGEVVFLGCG